MIGRPRPLFSSLLGVGLALASLAACAGNTPSPSAAHSPAVTAAPTASGSPGGSAAASGSVSPSASASQLLPSPTEDLHLPHVSAALEDKLPNVIGGTTLEKFSMTLAAYMASYAGGDKPLYTPWLVKFGKTPDDVNLAAALDLTQTESFHVQAIEVPGQTPAALVAGFANSARALGWPVTNRTIGGTAITQIVDSATAASGLGIAYVLAREDVIYIIVTDSPDLLVEALAKITTPL
jgi:hypothetical protein